MSNHGSNHKESDALTEAARTLEAEGLSTTTDFGSGLTVAGNAEGWNVPTTKVLYDEDNDYFELHSDIDPDSCGLKHEVAEYLEENGYDVIQVNSIY